MGYGSVNPLLTAQRAHVADFDRSQERQGNSEICTTLGLYFLLRLLELSHPATDPGRVLEGDSKLQLACVITVLRIYAASRYRHAQTAVAVAKAGPQTAKRYSGRSLLPYKLPGRSSSPFMGLSWHRGVKKWACQLRVDHQVEEGRDMLGSNLAAAVYSLVD